MSEEQKLIEEIATRLLEAKIKDSGYSKDKAYAHQCVSLAKVIVDESRG